MIDIPDLWLPCFDPGRVANARMRLFCFPHAGAGASLFYNWSVYMPMDIAVCPLQLPGRENRWGETAYTELSSLVSAIATVIKPYLDRPFALFGHSMGAVIAYELARYLYDSAYHRPTHLFVSGAPAPHLKDDVSTLHTLPDAEFLAEMQRRYGGFSATQWQEAELLQFLLPILRADFQLVENYLHDSGKLLDCPLTAIGGLQDLLVSMDALCGWYMYTSGPFHLYQLPGDHFFLRPMQAELIHLIMSALIPSERGSGSAQGTLTPTYSEARVGRADESR